MAKRIFYFLLIITFHFSGYSSNENFIFKRTTTQEGLSNSWVRCFYQDELGFIWIGTGDGLNRYDGVNFKIFHPLSNQNLSLGDVTINDITKKDNQHLWVATDLGLFLFNTVTEDFYLDTLLSPNPVMAIETDAEQNVWFGTNHGLFRYNQTSKQLISFSTTGKNSQNLSNDYINVLKTDSDNNLWIGTKGGLNCYESRSKKITHFISNNEKNSISGNDILAICEDSNKRLWVGTSLNGLNVLAHKDTTFQLVIEGAISSLLTDRNKLWIGSATGQGIRLLDLDKFSNGKTEITPLKNDPLVTTSIGDNSVFCFFADNLDDIWIGTYGNGFNYYSPRSKPFFNVSEKFSSDASIQNNLVNVFFEEDDFLWIGTEAGLDRLTKKTKKYDHFNFEIGNPNSLGSNTIFAIYKDSRKNLWVGTWAGGLNKFDYKTNSFKRYLPDGKPGSIGSSNVFCILEDHSNNLWIGTTSGGLNRFNYEDETFTIYKRDPNNPSSLNGRSMNDILQTKEGQLYISLYNSVDIYNYEKDNFEHLMRGNTKAGNIITLFQDSQNNIWFGTNAGLELFNPTNRRITTYTTADGLPNNTIQAILEDKHGNLWLSTNKGISKFIQGTRPQEGPHKFQNFSIADGLPANDFKKRSAYINNDGYMYFGSSNGYTFFHPDSIELNLNEPKIVFTNFQILENRSNDISKFESLKINLNHTNSITLNHPNTNFIIGFASLNYLNSKNNRYKYKMEGFDTEWIDAGSNMSATYTNLIEGEFTFKVKGTNNDGVWSKNPIELRIKVYPPWWKSNLLKLLILVSLLLTGIAILVIRFSLLNNENKLLEVKVEKRTNELSKLNRLLEEKQQKITIQNTELEKHRNQLEELVVERTSELVVARAKAEESDRLKSAFLANMSHEIRTPMNAIIGFSTILNDDDLSAEKREKYVEHIRSNGKTLSVLINDIIDISIIEANQLLLSKSKFNVDAILKELYHLFEFEKNTHIELRLVKNVTFNNLILFNDAIRFRQIMVNLLSNSFKYSDKGSIEFGYTLKEHEAEFFVTDTGIGIDQKELSKIFDHFYKTKKDKTKLYRGTGIGLAICKKLVEQMGGTIWVESKIKEGSTFYFTLPRIISE